MIFGFFGAFVVVVEVVVVVVVLVAGVVEVVVVVDVVGSVLVLTVVLLALGFIVVEAVDKFNDALTVEVTLELLRTTEEPAAVRLEVTFLLSTIPKVTLLAALDDGFILLLPPPPSGVDVVALCCCASLAFGFGSAMGVEVVVVLILTFSSTPFLANMRPFFACSCRACSAALLSPWTVVSAIAPINFATVAFSSSRWAVAAAVFCNPLPPLLQAKFGWCTINAMVSKWKHLYFIFLLC